MVTSVKTMLARPRRQRPFERDYLYRKYFFFPQSPLHPQSQATPLAP